MAVAFLWSKYMKVLKVISIIRTFHLSGPPDGQRGPDNRGYTVIIIVIVHVPYVEIAMSLPYSPPPSPSLSSPSPSSLPPFPSLSPSLPLSLPPPLAPLQRNAREGLVMGAALIVVFNPQYGHF